MVAFLLDLMIVVHLCLSFEIDPDRPSAWVSAVHPDGDSPNVMHISPFGRPTIRMLPEDAVFGYPYITMVGHMSFGSLQITPCDRGIYGLVDGGSIGQGHRVPETVSSASFNNEVMMESTPLSAQYGCGSNSDIDVVQG